MSTRRLFCGCLAGGLSFAATAVHAQPLECAVFTPDRQKSTAPDDAIARLKAGNERFMAGKSVNCDLLAQVKRTASNQSPYAAIVGCIDSRGHRSSHNYPLVQKVAEANARLTAASLTKRSLVIKELIDAGQLKIAAAMHDITTGKVTWLS
jgi:carbonic anhydrase